MSDNNKVFETTHKSGGCCGSGEHHGHKHEVDAADHTITVITMVTTAVMIMITITTTIMNTTTMPKST